MPGNDPVARGKVGAPGKPFEQQPSKHPVAACFHDRLVALARGQNFTKPPSRKAIKIERAFGSSGDVSLCGESREARVGDAPDLRRRAGDSPFGRPRANRG